MKIIFQIDGGIGKNIAATAVCKAVKRRYSGDQLIVIYGDYLKRFTWLFFFKMADVYANLSKKRSRTIPEL